MQKQTQVAVLVALAAGRIVAAPDVIVGFAQRDFVDESRRSWPGTGARPLATLIWYPAARGSKVRPPQHLQPAPFFQMPNVAEGAEVRAPSARCPLVVLSHGSQGAAMTLDWLARRLVAEGYIVAAVNHHGDTQTEAGGPLPQSFGTPWERAIDVSVLIDKLLADRTFGPRIDAARVGAAGYSAGGATVLELAGAVFDANEFQAFCATNPADGVCTPPPMVLDAIAKLVELRRTDAVVQASFARASAPYRDTRVRAVLALAPAIGVGHTQQSLSSIRVPVAIVVGQADTIAPAATNAQRYARSIPTAKLTLLPGNVGHFIFGSLCTPQGLEALAFVCRDAAGVDRATVQREVGDLAAELFRRAFSAK